MVRRASTYAQGFTVIELMIVVLVLGVLAATAVPAVLKYVHNSQTAEAVDKLDLMFRGSVTYVLDSNEAVERGTAGAGIGAQFPVDQALTPADKCCIELDGRCDGGHLWEEPTWQAMQFQISDPHRFRYAYESDGAGVGAMFTARASGDFDCDDNLSTFERAGFITEDLNVQGGHGIFRSQPLE